MKKIFSYFIGVAGYFLLAKFCLMLAIPPGYSSPLWLPIGFSCALLFVFGTRVATVSTFIGSFLINFHSSSPQLTLKASTSGLLAVCIALGSALCVWQAAYFVKKFSRYTLPNETTSLRYEKRALGLLLVLGMYCTLISSLIGTTALVLFKIVDTDFFFVTWAHWWVGDGIGVILLVPLGVLWSRHQGPHSVWMWVKSLFPTLAVLFCLLVVFREGGNTEALSQEEIFYRNSERLTSEIEDDVRVDSELLNALVSFYQGSTLVEEYEFHNFLKGLFSKHRYMEQIIWIPSGQSRLYKDFYSHANELEKFDPLYVKDKVWPLHKNDREPRLGPELQDRQLFIFPVSKDNQFLGLVVGVMDSEKLITAATQKSDLQNFEIEFQDTTTHKSSYWRNDSFSNIQRKFKNGLVIHDHSFPILNHEWKLSVVTTRMELYKGLPRATTVNLFFGLIFAFFVSALQTLLYLRAQKSE